MGAQIHGDKNNFALTAIITVFYQLFFFVIAASYKFDKVTDLAGGSNFVVINILTWCISALPDPEYRQSAATWLVVAWGVRLSAFLFYRIIMIGDDNRFDGLRDRPCQFLVFWVFQMAGVWVVSLPVTFVNSFENDDIPRGVSAWDVVGTIMAIIGLIVEAIADQEKFNFKQNPEKKGKWCDVGLWGVSRHPNYFGELFFWWGIFILCSTSIQHADWAYFTIVGPLFITSILFGLSGLPLLEKSANERYADNADYLKYREQTSILIPLPTSLYSGLPKIVKAIFLLEWPLFETNLHPSGVKAPMIQRENNA